MKPVYCEQHGKFRIIIPASITGTGKRQMRFFNSKSEAEAEAIRIRREGIDPKRDLKSDDITILNLLKKRYGDDATEIIRRLDFAEKYLDAVPKEKRLTLEQVCEAYIAYHKKEQNNWRTVSKYDSTTDRLCAALNPNMPFVELTEEKIDHYLSQWKPGGNRLAQYRNVHAFVVWAWRNKYIAANPLALSKPKDKPRAKKGILKVEDFRRILFLSAEKFPRLLPFFVLGGFAGLRRCEMISSQSVTEDPRLEWSDIDFKLNKVRIRQEVAKETRAEDRRRSIPLEPTAKEWLQLVAKAQGPVIEISQSTLQREKEALLDMLGGLKVPDNALRNSYASYGAAFRSIGDIARAMGDLEVTIKRYYVDLVDDPELGRAWFAIRPDSERKIISMVA
jgi:site-specific recombinase XerD